MVDARNHIMQNTQYVSYAKYKRLKKLVSWKYVECMRLKASLFRMRKELNELQNSKVNKKTNWTDICLLMMTVILFMDIIYYVLNRVPVPYNDSNLIIS